MGVVLLLWQSHWDFSMFDLGHGNIQPARAITVLFYLNEGFTGGETYFPKAVVSGNRGVRIKPQKGKAILFYGHLPDGNMDVYSQHESLPVQQGEKVSCGRVW